MNEQRINELMELHRHTLEKLAQSDSTRPDPIRDVDAVCFDAFGTLVEITVPQRAYVHLLRAVKGQERLALKRRLMREPLMPDQWGQAIGADISSDVLARVETDLKREIDAMAMRPGLREIWQTLRSARLKIGLCSNLAAPYGPPLRALLPDAPDAEVLSYNEGHIKPEPELYRRVIKRLAMPPERILFVGDTYRADIEGPQKAGMKAMEISEFETVMVEHSPMTEAEKERIRERMETHRHTLDKLAR